MSRSYFIVRRTNRGLNQGPILGVTQDQVNFNASGDQTLVTAVTGRIIKVHKLLIVGSGASNIRFYSGPSSEADPLTGQMNFLSNWALTLDSDDFMISPASGKALVLNSSAIIQVGGIIVYSVL